MTQVKWCDRKKYSVKFGLTNRSINFSPRLRLSPTIFKHCFFFMVKNVRFIQKRFRKSVHTYKPMMFRKHLQFSKNISDIFHIFGVRKRHIFKMLMHYHWQFKFIEIRPYIQSCNVPKRLQFSTNLSDIIYIFGEKKRHIFKMLPVMNYHRQLKFIFSKQRQE